MSVKRFFSEKRGEYQAEATRLARELVEFVGCSGLTGVRMARRYDVEGAPASILEAAENGVFAEPQVEVLHVEELPASGPEKPAFELVVQALPGQFDQTADSCAQCLQMLGAPTQPLVRTATVYQFFGELSATDKERIEHYLVNPVENHVVGPEKPQTLQSSAEAPHEVERLDGFCELDKGGLGDVLTRYGLAMDQDDLAFLQDYFANTEHRDPTITELRVIDTYWSDHCRHTTYGTHLEVGELADARVARAYERYKQARREVYGEVAELRPQTLMDIATIGAKVLGKRGLLGELDKSEEINACSIHVDAEVDGAREDWLLMFKNETHNHPTEIEPFGGAATCIGGCIRDPLSGRAYVHQAMRVSGSADPRTPYADTLAHKLPQRQIAQGSAQGYSSYGNQIGLATGLVKELYHPGFVAKHLECGAVLAAAPADHVRREAPAPGDVVVLLGGRTGRDGIGGATGSSKSHSETSLQTMASEVQKGNAPEERKIQRLFRNPQFTRLIKRCNDFGAGGVSVAVGELADGLDIDLDAVRKKYDGLDGTELAISESQERMAVVLDPRDVDAFCAAAFAENLEAYEVARVVSDARMKMRWQGQVICDLSREFLNSNGATKHAKVEVGECALRPSAGAAPGAGPGVGVGASTFGDAPRTLRELAQSLAFASQKGLVERFDATVGAGSLFMPYGGAAQRTAAQTMASLLPVSPQQTTTTASVMAHGCALDLLEADPFSGAYASVKISLAKLVASGASYRDAYLTLQEFFCRMTSDPTCWGVPFSAMLGALTAQLDFETAAIGGKDSMSGTFVDLDVPPTLISFAVAPADARHLVTNEFKGAGHNVYLFFARSVPEQRSAWDAVHELAGRGAIFSASAVDACVAASVVEASFGNSVGFAGEDDVAWFAPCTGAILVETELELEAPFATLVGRTVEAPEVRLGDDAAGVEELWGLSSGVLEDVYPTGAGEPNAPDDVPALAYTGGPSVITAGYVSKKPQVLIPVFPGTNCEYDSARAVLSAGLLPHEVVVNTSSPASLAASVDEVATQLAKSQVLFLPGGFSGGDEPNGAAKFIVSFFRNAQVTEALHELLDKRAGLVLGICNGFQALIKLGLLPYGHIVEPSRHAPTLTYNTIGRHVSQIARVRVCSNLSPWFANCEVGEEFLVPVSHGEGRFVAPEDELERLVAAGQVATQYVDAAGRPTMRAPHNPNGSTLAIEGITSPDGRILGKMGHAERIGSLLYQNVAGAYDMGLFASAASYFSS